MKNYPNLKAQASQALSKIMRSGSINIIVTCAMVLLIVRSNAANLCMQDTLSRRVKRLAEKLDSMHIKGVSLNTDSEAFKIFGALYKIASDKELIYLIEHSQNGGVRAYSYIGLLIKNNK